tara:strand:- start:10443 stop:11291 length:849 start_codon:yes stop_codon:yes gene_type:complete
MSKEGLGVIVEAKQEYTKQMKSLLSNRIYTTFIETYEIVKEENEERLKIIYNFQVKLREIPKWNSTQIEEQVTKLTNECEWFGDLLAAIFISNVKILTSVKMNETTQKIKIKMPTNDAFVHKAFSACAETIYNKPHMFMLKAFQKGVHLYKEDVISLLECSIDNTIRDLLPLQNILQMYIGESMRDEEEQPEDGEEEAEDFGPSDIDDDPETKTEDGHVEDVPNLPDPPAEPEDLNAADLSEETKSIQTGGFFGKPGTPKATPPNSPRGGPQEGFGSDLEDD